MKKLTVSLSDELHRRFKVACSLQGCDMSEALRKLVEDYVEETERRKLIVVPTETRELAAPICGVPGPGDSAMGICPQLDYNFRS